MTEAEAQIRLRETESEAVRPVLPDSDGSAPEAPPAATSPAVDNALPEDRYLNRELSWLEFNARVLALAADTSLPLLERAKFLAIFASNLDEVYMVRVAGLKRRLDMGLTVRSSSGLTPRETLARVAELTQELVARHSRLWRDDVEPALETAGIRVLHWQELDGAERTRLAEYFRAQVFPRS